MKLWYAIKKQLPNAEIDIKNCNYCFNSLRMLTDLHPDQVLVIVPDRNCFGVITKYHLGRIRREAINKTKIYKDLEGDI
jgi:hypothetical protein